MEMLNINCRHDISDEDTYCCYVHGHIMICPYGCKDYEPVTLEPIDPWIEPDNPPDTDRYILISFANYPLPCIGMYKADPGHGGAYYGTDADRSLVSYGFMVNGWMELPKCKQEVAW